MRILKTLYVLILVLTLASGCTTVPTLEEPTIDPTALFRSALLTATYAIKPAGNSPTTPVKDTPEPTSSQPTDTPSAPRTPPALPQFFTTEYLNKLDTPHQYIQDTCQYLKMRLDPNNSSPGTVVMPIMFHSVTDDTIATKEFQITHETLIQLLDNLKSQGFQSISIDQLIGFLYKNEKIPSRSVLLIVDDRHHEAYFRTHFEEKLKQFGWTVTNAWISYPGTTEDLWAENARVQSEGWVDHQGHGVVHNITVENWDPNTPITTDIYGTISAEEYIRRELNGSRDSIQQRFGKQPLAYIWPGGGFSSLSIKLAREAGYKVGFTVNPRGPLMFNWIPLSDGKDDARPSYIPEGQMDDPLLVLPRYWDVDASNQIDTVRTIGKQAAAEADKNKTIEMEYYDIVCKPKTGEIPSLKK